jgi:hypothetical protein
MSDTKCGTNLAADPGFSLPLKPGYLLILSREAGEGHRANGSGPKWPAR